MPTVFKLILESTILETHSTAKLEVPPNGSCNKLIQQHLEQTTAILTFESCAMCSRAQSLSWSYCSWDE